LGGNTKTHQLSLMRFCVGDPSESLNSNVRFYAALSRKHLGARFANPADLLISTQIWVTNAKQHRDCGAVLHW